MEQRKIIKGFVFIIACLILISGYFLTGDLRNPDSSLASNNNTKEPPASMEQIINSNAVRNIVEEAGPAVVKITTKNEIKGTPFNRYFFDEQQPRRESTGLGSGFIISESGLVVTNQHVIDGASEITVTVEDNNKNEKEYRAEIVGSNYDLDLALLKIKSIKNFPHLEIGDSSEVKVGSWVVAIGNPYGFDHTVTTGVISARERPVTIEDRHYKNLLQTDAAINPGNSGGPLLNLQGEVIGINTAVANAQGIGFAIPSNTLQESLEDLKEGGQDTQQPWLGVQIINMSPGIAQELNLEDSNGVIVAGVISGSPADKAGIQQKDVILKVNGKRVEDVDSLVALVSEMTPGEKGSLVIYRNDKILNLTFTAGEKPVRY